MSNKWKEVKHDNSITWLAFWNDPINPKEFKHVFLVSSSALNGQNDKEQYDKVILLKGNASWEFYKFVGNFDNDLHDILTSFVTCK